MSAEITELTASVQPRGRPFPKGVSGNPGGRPRVLDGVRTAAQARTTEMLDVLASIALDPKAPHAARVSAANSYLDRALGRPLKEVVLHDERGDDVYREELRRQVHEALAKTERLNDAMRRELADRVMS
jgi:hypothetical protein